jgi:hypothetical protein
MGGRLVELGCRGRWSLFGSRGSGSSLPASVLEKPRTTGQPHTYVIDRVVEHADQGLASQPRLNR